MWKFKSLLLVAVAFICLVAPATAQDTGSIAGAVFDANGTPVADAVVRVSGAFLPSGRTFTTSESGVFQFTRLLPGTYAVEVSKTDVGTSKREIVVELDRVAQADMVLGLAVQETIDVQAVRSAVDLRKTEVNLNYNAAAIEELPLERSYRGLFQLVPGVADNRSEVGISAGGSRQDNTYLVDGVNITNPSFGTLSTEVNELDIAEFNVKRGGISAEFGRASGIVTNAISRSGTNRISGQGRIEWMPQGLIGEYKNPAFVDSLLKTSVNPAVSLGGPVLRDRLFFYGSARYFEQTRGDRTNRLGTDLPDRVESGHELFGKLTGSPTPRHLINVGYRDRPYTTEATNLDAATDPSVGYDAENKNKVATATWAVFPTSRSTVDLKYLYLKEGFEGVPVTDLGYLPTFNINNLTAMGYYQDPNQNNVRFGGYEYGQRINYRRHEVKATYTQFMDYGMTTHELKVGGGYEFGEEDYFRLTNGWGDLVRQTVSGQPRIRARYYFEQSPQLGQGRTSSAFVQDNMTIGRRFVINAGLLINKDEFAQELAGSNGCPVVALVGGNAVWESKGDRCTMIRFGWGDQVQPRLGLNYVVREGKGDKAYVNWGRYYSSDQKSSARSLAPRRIYQNEAFFDAVTGALISNLPRASTTGKLIDPDITPTYSDEVLLGYATPIQGSWSLDAFFQWKDFTNFIEDVPSVFPSTGPYAAANLPCDRWEACRFEARRTYKAFTAEVRGRLMNSIATTVSYTLSRLEGNFDLDYSTVAVFNTSSIIQDGPGTFVQDPNREGPLFQDRPHVFKLFADYRPVENIGLGGYLRVQSGSPWAARGPDTQGSGNLNYLEPAGSHRNPVWTNFDLIASYTLTFNDRSRVRLGATLMNVFGNQTRLGTDSRQYLTLNSISTPPFIGPYTNPNPLFGTADSYTPPRRLVLTANVAF